MHGDFSQRQRLIDANLAGVLYQQGRVFFDTDGNAQTQIANAWQDTAGKDAFGAGVAAVPADAPASFRVDSAALAAAPRQIDLRVQPGRCWADGLLAHLEGAPAPLLRGATYVVPPVQPLPAPLVPVAGSRDAVLLDVWRESLSAFQQPHDLIEPALGGPDTTERLATNMAFRLLRMASGDTCANIASKVDDHFNNKGRLTVSLQPVVAVGGDCPVVDAGGYVGFEHNLYRIEIAELAPGQPAQFKWSQFNGGLVGRAIFDAGTRRAQITANLQAIITCGLPSFYLETREFDPYYGHWKTTYAANVTLNNLNELVLPAAATFGAIPPAGREVFFRLWNGLRPVADFPMGAATPLVDGIRLEFQAEAVGRYTPEDFWTFTVRADGVENALIPGLPVPTLLDNELPEGVHHHRVPLAEITWQRVPAGLAPEVEDCRRVFQPLTKLKTCCTYRVGDGVESFGDYDRIQHAIDALPRDGGEICLLPGTFNENVLIDGRRNIRVHGCGHRSRVVGPSAAGGGAAAPVFRVRNSRNISLETFSVEAAVGGAGIVLEGANDELLPAGDASVPRLREILIEAMRISAGERCAIEGAGGQFITVRRCDIRMRDVRGSAPGVFLRGDDLEVEHNRIRVRSASQADDDGPTLALPVSTGRGGLQIGGTSERVRIIDNLIQGGRGNGITLGSVFLDARRRKEHRGWVIDRDDPCNPCRDGTTRHPDPGSEGPDIEVSSAGPLYDIRIERNRILDMGMSGIGVVGFFNLARTEEVISVLGLDILGNEIRRCLARGVIAPDAAMLSIMGYGAIQLAAVSDCVINANTLADNGPSHIPALCGIYVLHAAGIDISDNHIVNNGAKTAEPEDRSEDGARAGVFIAFATAPMIMTTADPQRLRLPGPGGPPAVKVHDNIVSQPVGQALYVVAWGPVSVEGNQLASRGNLRRLRPLSSTFIATTVLIFDLGVSTEEDSKYLSFGYHDSALKPQRRDEEALVGDYQPEAFDLGRPSEGMAASRQPATAAGGVPPGVAADHSREHLAEANRVFVTARPAPAAAVPAPIFAGGNVMFTDNQVRFESPQPGEGLALSSILIASLDDIGFESNQCDCNLGRDFLIAQAAVLGVSVRVIGNRFKEGRYDAFFSAITFGIPMNCTSQNQATHCIYADSTSPRHYLAFSDNMMLWGPLGTTSNNDETKDDERICERFHQRKR